MRDWKTTDEGKTIGTVGSERGFIVQDEEHDLGARITLERNCSSSPYAITCGIYGWMMHTRFFGSSEVAESQYDEMKQELARILGILLKEPDASRQSSAAIPSRIEEFLTRFP